MLMPPTTTITISRGTDQDVWGDEVNSLNQLYVGVPAIINYQTGVSKDPSTGAPVQASAYEVVVPKGTDVKDQDVLTDSQTGEQYEVTSVRILPSYGVPADVWLAVRRLDGT